MSIARYGLNSQGVFVSMTDGGYVSYQDYAKLAAENAGLKAAIETHKHGFVRCNCCGDELMCHTDDVCRALDDTPSTDALLAEVRASAIEHAASERWGSGYVFDELNEFAAQLRKGVQS